MSAISVVHWTVHLPESVLLHPCPRCDVERPHPFSGRARLNANGRLLDAWLLFTCVHCSRTAKVPVFERRPVRSVEPGLLAALQSNDLVVLEPLAASLVGGAGFRLVGPTLDAGIVVLRVEPGVRVRLDRVLAHGLRCSRAAVRLRCPDARLSRRVVDGLRIRVVSVQRTEASSEDESAISRLQEPR